MNFKKIGAAAMAAALMAATAVTASAAEQMELLTAPTSSVGMTNDYGAYYGSGVFLSPEGSFRVDEDELASWRETGELTPTTIKTDFDVKEFDSWRSGVFYDGGDYIQMVSTDDDGNVKGNRIIVKLDRKNATLTTAYTAPQSWSYTRSDGYTIRSGMMNDKLLLVEVIGPDGKGTDTTLTYNGNGDLWYYTYASVGTGKYVGYIMWQTDERVNEFGFDEYDYVLYGVDKKAKLVELIKGTDCDMGMYGAGENYVVWGALPMARSMQYHVYLPDSGKDYNIGSMLYKEGAAENAKYYAINGISGDKVYGTKAILSVDAPQSGGTRYVLADISKVSSNSTFSFNAYKSMSTTDGKIYLVQTEDDKWGYIDANGKVLGTFDDASRFYGDYAPVVKNGKGYLIDRSMNRVSGEIAATHVNSMDEELFVFINGDDGYLVTFAGKPASVPSTPSTPSTPTTPENPGSTEKDNPDTGAQGIALAIGTAALAGAAVVITRKRK